MFAEVESTFNNRRPQGLGGGANGDEREQLVLLKFPTNVNISAPVIFGVTTGGVNSSNVANMSGGWYRNFDLASAAPATVTFNYRLTGNGLDSSEFGQLLVSINGVLKTIPYDAQVGGTGATMTTGWQSATVSLGSLPAGTHVITIGVFQTRKTGTDETAVLQLDDVVLTVEH